MSVTDYLIQLDVDEGGQVSRLRHRQPPLQRVDLEERQATQDKQQEHIRMYEDYKMTVTQQK